MHKTAFICFDEKQKTPVNVVFTGVCFDMHFEKVELAGTEPISYTAKYQIFNFSKSYKLPNYHLENVLFRVSGCFHLQNQR